MIWPGCQVNIMIYIGAKIMANQQKIGLESFDMKTYFIDSGDILPLILKVGFKGVSLNRKCSLGQ